MLNAVRVGYILRNIMNILTEYTIYGCQNITLVMTQKKIVQDILNIMIYFLILKEETICTVFLREPRMVEV